MNPQLNNWITTMNKRRFWIVSCRHYKWRAVGFLVARVPPRHRKPLAIVVLQELLQLEAIQLLRNEWLWLKRTTSTHRLVSSKAAESTSQLKCSNWLKPTKNRENVRCLMDSTVIPLLDSLLYSLVPSRSRDVKLWVWLGGRGVANIVNNAASD